MTSFTPLEQNHMRSLYKCLGGSLRPYLKSNRLVYRLYDKDNNPIVNLNHSIITVFKNSGFMKVTGESYTIDLTNWLIKKTLCLK